MELLLESSIIITQTTTEMLAASVMTLKFKTWS